MKYAGYKTFQEDSADECFRNHANRSRYGYYGPHNWAS